MTFRTAVDKSIQLWDKLAVTGGYDKSEFMTELNILNNCYLCEALRRKGDRYTDCNRCIPFLKWKKAKGLDKYCQRKGSPYENWREAVSPEEHRFYAQEVADLLRKAREKGVIKKLGRLFKRNYRRAS